MSSRPDRGDPFSSRFGELPSPHDNYHPISRLQLHLNLSAWMLLEAPCGLRRG